MSHPDLAEESTRLLQQTWRYFAHHLPGGGAFTEPGVLITDGRSPLPFMNAGFFSDGVRDVHDLRQRVERLAAHFRTHQAPWVLMADQRMMPPDVAAALGPLCADLGLQHLFTMTGMVTDHLEAPLRAAPDLTLRLVTDAAGRGAVGDVNAAAYAMPAELMRAATLEPGIWSAMVGVVGAVGETAVATASVAAIDDVAYVCLVATDPAHQRRGYAETVMRHALREATREFGVTRTILHATPAGRPVYARMGYAAVCDTEVYLCAPVPE